MGAICRRRRTGARRGGRSGRDDVSDSTTFRVLNAPPTIRLIDAPTRAVVGRPVRVSFKVSERRRRAGHQVSTRSGIVFSRRYLIRDGTGVVKWTPKSPGSAVLLIRARGHQGQTASASLRLDGRTPPRRRHASDRDPAPGAGDARRSDARRPFAFRADGLPTAVARIEGSWGRDSAIWRFPCPAPRARFTWTPTSPGRYSGHAIAHGDGTTAQATTQLTVGGPR